MRPAPPPNLAFVVALVLAFGVLSALLFFPFLTYLLLGGLIVYAVYPLFRWLSRWTKRPRLSAALVLTIVLLAIFVPFGYLSWLLVNEARAFSATVTPESVALQVDSTVTALMGLVGIEPEPNATYGRQIFDAVVPALQAYAADALPDILVLIAGFVLGMFVLAFVVYYGLLDGPTLVRWVGSVLPLTSAQYQHLVAEVKKIVDAVFLGHMVGAILQGALATVGFLIFGVPGVLVWGIVMMILSIIPFLGAFLIWAPAGVWLLATGQTWQGIGLLAWGAILVSNIDNFVKPLLVGSRARIHPLLVLVGVLGGFVAFGAMGFIIGPLVLALFLAVINFWREDYLPAYRKATWHESLESVLGRTGEGTDEAPPR